MDTVLTRLLGFVLKAVLLVAGLVVFFSLLTAAVLLAALWGLRALWARMTGRPITPWVMGIDPRGAWRAAAGQGWRRGAPGAADAHGANGSGDEPPVPPQAGAAGPLMRPLPGTEDVTDVQPRSSRGASEPRT